mmetsp:Transcript_33396/g.72869  ORF Transcript_33396/g.72869 Transcript_33396/m.72869 type:complete len:220 (+) Transcript_33396:1031-1690(+)
MPSKSSRWKGRRSSRAALRTSVVPAMIILRTARMRSSEPKNMCSERTSPMPSAPFLRATAASSGVSALVSTLRVRCSSTQLMNLSRSPAISAGASSALPRITSPVLPLREIQSFSCTVTPPRVKVRASSFTWRAAQPETHVLPQPRATTAAWEVMPPRAVRMPSEADMPPTSSGLVSVRTRMQGMPAAFVITAASPENTTWPTAAPGEAGRPVPSTSAA